MRYIDYINLGFEREDYKDSVVFDKTGYTAYHLKKSINDNCYVCVSSEDLNNAKLTVMTDKENERVIRFHLPQEAIKHVFK